MHLGLLEDRNARCTCPHVLFRDHQSTNIPSAMKARLAASAESIDMVAVNENQHFCLLVMMMKRSVIAHNPLPGTTGAWRHVLSH